MGKTYVFHTTCGAFDLKERFTESFLNQLEKPTNNYK